jgi:iron complex outermembrane receptor protein
MPANVGNSRLQGAELEVEIHPVENLVIDSSASYIDFEYRDVAAATGVTLGMTTPFTPKWKASLGAQYEMPLAQLGTVTPRVDYSYPSEMFVAAVNGQPGRPREWFVTIKRRF